MSSILDEFNSFPSQRMVAELMLDYGIKVKDKKAYCGEIEISDTALARAANVDRRIVRSTINRISGSQTLLNVFSKLMSMPMLADVAPIMGCTVIEVIPTDARIPGILSDVMGVVYSSGLSIRQAVVSDSGFSDTKAKLIIIIDGNLPPQYITSIKNCRGVKEVVLR